MVNSVLAVTLETLEYTAHLRIEDMSLACGLAVLWTTDAALSQGS